MRRALAGLIARHRRARDAGGPETGTTLVELMVAMIIMSIAGAIFTTAVVSLSRTTNQAQAINNATDQNNRAFQTLDRTVRYASAITTPARVNGSWYVELRTTTTGAEVCTQLRTNATTRQLQSRTWTVSGSTTPVPSAWTPLASGLTNAGVSTGTTQPFALPTQGASATRQRLQFYLVSQAGPTSQLASSTSSFTLTAVNSSSAAVPTPAFCQQVARS